MWIGWIEFDLLLGDVHSLKGKRSLIRPLIADLARTFSVAVAEVEHHDLHRRAAIGASTVAADARHVTDVLDAIERFVANRPEFELLAARRGLVTTED